MAAGFRCPFRCPSFVRAGVGPRQQSRPWPRQRTRQASQRWRPWRSGRIPLQSPRAVNPGLVLGKWWPPPPGFGQKRPPASRPWKTAGPQRNSSAGLAKAPQSGPGRAGAPLASPTARLRTRFDQRSYPSTEPQDQPDRGRFRVLAGSFAHELDGRECGDAYYGRRVSSPHPSTPSRKRIPCGGLSCADSIRL